MKTAIALLALFVVATNAAIAPLEKVQPIDARGKYDGLVVIHEISKEVTQLVQLYQTCQSYENETLKGACLVKFSRQLADGVNALGEITKEKGQAWDLTKEITILLVKISREVKTLINIAHDCKSYESETRRATCWTRFSLELASSIANLTNTIINMVNKGNGGDAMAFLEALVPVPPVLQNF